MTTFSFRAECPHDVAEFQKECAKAHLTVTMITKRPERTYPDVEAQITSPLDIEVLRNTMYSVEDGHVMGETLRDCALKDNPLTRDADPF